MRVRSEMCWLGEAATFERREPDRKMICRKNRDIRRRISSGVSASARKEHTERRLEEREDHERPTTGHQCSRCCELCSPSPHRGQEKLGERRGRSSGEAGGGKELTVDEERISREGKEATTWCHPCPGRAIGLQAEHQQWPGEESVGVSHVY